MISPQDAKGLGLVNHVIPESDLLRQTQGLAKKIAMKPAVAIAQALKAVTLGLEQSPWLPHWVWNWKASAKCCQSPDMAEGIKAFTEKDSRSSPINKSRATMG